MTRIIAGHAGSLRLEVPKAGTRPTSDRVREAIFSTLDSWGVLDGASVLDLYAGSGALGLESASRGSARVTMVEKHPQSAQITQRNAHKLTDALKGSVTPTLLVARQSVQTFLQGQDQGWRFDIVFIDPPYDLLQGELSTNLAALAPLLAEGAVVMVERSSRSPEPDWPDGLELIKEKRYGETSVWWAEQAG